MEQLKLRPVNNLHDCDKFISGVGFSCLDCSPGYDPACCSCFEHSEHREHTWLAADDSRRLCRNVELDNLFADLSQTQFLELFTIACVAVHVIIDSDASQKSRGELLEQLKKYPQLVRAVSIVLLTSGDNVRIE